MKSLFRVLVTMASCCLIGACAPKAATPSVDILASSVAQVAASLVAQTAAAASPTPLPPTLTATPSDTATPAVTDTPSGPPRRPQTASDGVECWLGGPGAPNALETRINHGKAVDVLGMGNAAGWVVIRDPYFHRPCWILETDLKFFQPLDPTQLTVMTPGVPGPGQ